MTKIQQPRRTNPYPWTWEIPLAVAIGVVFALIMGVHGGRAVANWFSGTPLLFPDGGALLTSWPPVLGGDSTAGLSDPPPNAASPGALWAWLVIVETAVIAGIIAAIVWGLRRWGPSRLHGMADPTEAEELLGLTRLRRHAHIVRPDLYPATQRRGR